MDSYRDQSLSLQSLSNTYRLTNAPRELLPRNRRENLDFRTCVFHWRLLCNMRMRMRLLALHLPILPT